MAQRKKPRPKNGLKASDRLTFPVSTGYTLVMARPSMHMVRAILAKAEALYPDPEPPTEEIVTVTGDTIHVVQKTEDHQLAQERVEYQRLEHLLEYVFNKRLEVEGYETEESKRELIAQFAEERAELEEFGTLPDDMQALDEWQLTLRMFIVADGGDYAALMFAAQQAFDQSNIKEDDIRQRVTFL